MLTLTAFAFERLSIAKTNRRWQKEQAANKGQGCGLGLRFRFGFREGVVGDTGDTGRWIDNNEA